jgi:hypothetical protein
MKTKEDLLMIMILGLGLSLIALGVALELVWRLAR